MWQALENWLGPGPLRLLVGLLILTGLLSLGMRIFFPDEAWSLSLQTLLVLVFVAIAFWVISGRLSLEARRRSLVRFGPAMLALLLGALFPSLLPLFMGAALGWILVAQFVLRDPMQPEYKQAIKAMRQQDYRAAITAMNTLISREPKDARHYSFRAQLYRLNGDLKRALRDYEQVLQLEESSGIGQNGMAEVYLQQGRLAEARRWAEAAYAQAQQDWVAVYNLGMIAERQGDDAAAQQHLEEALRRRLPDSRHRLLTRLWLARVYYRQGNESAAANMVNELQMERSGLKEWRSILESEEARPMRHLLQADIDAAAALLDKRPMTRVFDVEG